MMAAVLVGERERDFEARMGGMKIFPQLFPVMLSLPPPALTPKKLWVFSLYFFPTAVCDALLLLLLLLLWLLPVPQKF